MGKKIIRKPNPLKRSLEDARREVEVGKWQGIECPCCNQWAKVYPRTLSHGYAKALIQIYREAHRTWVHVQSLPNGPKGGDYAKLRFWGLLEKSPERQEGEQSAGMWRVTRAGRLFVLGRSEVPKYALIYDDQFYGFEGPEISIHEALGKKFRLDELLDGPD